MNEPELRDVIEQVVGRVLGTFQTSGGAATAAAPPPPARSGGAVPSGDGVFDRMEDAIEASDQAFRAYSRMTLEARSAIVAILRKTGLQHKEFIARETVQETGMGRAEHKMMKFDLIAERTPGVEFLRTWAQSGDHGLTVEEMAPYGVIGAVTPSTHPVPTLLNNAISLLAAGNVGVFNAHPASKTVFAKGVAIFNRAIVQAGGPPNLLTTVKVPTLETADLMFKHPKTRILLVTGGPGVVKAALQVPKKVIAAGPGNPPVVVDETADIPRAARGIIAGGAFDNNLVCIGEKEVFVVDSVADALMRDMVSQGCVMLNASQVEALAQLAFERKEGSRHAVLKRDFVGKNASVLAKAIGLSVPDSVPLLIGETMKDHLWVQEEQMMPFMPIVRCRDVYQAIDWALEAEHGFRHTAIMHSKNIESMSIMAQRCDCSIFVKNGPSLAGLGAGGEGYTSFSIASPTGEGLTTCRTFTRFRRCTLVDYFRIV